MAISPAQLSLFSFLSTTAKTATTTTTTTLVKVADILDEVVTLMAVGFEYYVEVEDHKLFRTGRLINGLSRKSMLKLRDYFAAVVLHILEVA